MEISFKRSGGVVHVPAFNQPLVVQSAQLPVDEAERLTHLVADADFFHLPHVFNLPARGAADCPTYTITIRDAERCHSVRCSDPIGNERLQTLVAYLQAKESMQWYARQHS